MSNDDEEYIAKSSSEDEEEEIDHLAESSDEGQVENPPAAKPKRKGAYGTKAFNPEGPKAALIVKAVLNNRNVDPDKFATLVDNVPEVKEWIDSKEIKRDNLRRRYPGLVKNLDEYLKTGNGKLTTDCIMLCLLHNH